MRLFHSHLFVAAAALSASLLCLSSPLPVSAAPPCLRGVTEALNLSALGPVKYEELFDLVTPVTNLSGKVREVPVQDLKVFTLTDAFKKSNEVLVGFGQPNVYLIVPDGKGGYLRYAAKSLKRGPSKIEQAYRAQSGVLFRFKDLPPETIEKLRAAMLSHEGTRQWTCANSVCRVLQDAGIRSGEEPLQDRYMPHSLLKDFVRDGFTVDGKPLDVEVVRTTPANIEDFYLGVLKSEAGTPIRHAKRALVDWGAKHKVSMEWLFPKKVGAEGSGLAVDQVETSIQLPTQQTVVHDLNLKISRPDQIGLMLRTLWGRHTLYQLTQKAVSVDEYLPDILKPFPQENPDFVTKLKKNFLFSEPVVSLLRSRLVDGYHKMGSQTQGQIFAMMDVDRPASPNKYNIVITGDAITVAMVQVKHKHVDWILSKHVLISGYSPDVRFAGEVWKAPDGVIYLNHNSGTYRPNDAQLEKALAYLRRVFPDVEIRVAP